MMLLRASTAFAALRASLASGFPGLLDNEGDIEHGLKRRRNLSKTFADNCDANPRNFFPDHAPKIARIPLPLFT
jgi:hypothetical protein